MDCGKPPRLCDTEYFRNNIRIMFQKSSPSELLKSRSEEVNLYSPSNGGEYIEKWIDSSGTSVNTSQESPL